MERKIGEVFECNGVKLRVEPEVYMCRGCYFNRDFYQWCNQYKSVRGEYQKASRSDRGVIFKKVENMKERTIKLTLEKAKEFYKKGGEFRDLALSAFTEEELTKVELPKTWEEFCNQFKIYREYYIDIDSNVEEPGSGYRDRDLLYDRNMLPSRKAAEQHLALMQLHQLRDCYRQGWKPDFLDTSTKYCVKVKNDYVYLYTSRETSCFLSFQSQDIADEFMENFRDLIIKAGDLL